MALGWAFFGDRCAPRWWPPSPGVRR